MELNKEVVGGVCSQGLKSDHVGVIQVVALVNKLLIIVDDYLFD